MYRDVEEDLMRELREVAERVEVPAMPALPSDPPSRWAWQPALVAAAVLLVVLGVAATILRLGDDRTVQPAPSPSPTEATERLSTAAPTTPYVVGGRLFVGGEQVPGTWWSVDGTETGWVGIREDGSYWWGYDAQPKPMEGRMDQPPVVSPGGGFIARIVVEDGQGMLNGFDTRPAGEGFGLGVEVPAMVQGIYSRAAAVTDDALVVASGADFQEVWRPLDGGGVVQLADTAPGQVVLTNTVAGLVVVEGRYDSADGTQGDPYLADLSRDGTLTRLHDLPNFALVVASEEWLAWVEPGAIGGDALTVDRLQVQRLGGGGAAELLPPEGFAFRPVDVVWEEQDRLLARVVDDSGEERVVRCSPAGPECVLVDTP